MPKKVKFTREDIASAAMELVRSNGAEALSARTLAAAIGCSTAPIFTAFSSIDEVLDEVKSRGYMLYTEYIKKGLTADVPFKAAGLMYIKFAKDEPKLFELIFMGKSDIATGYFPSGDKNEVAVRQSMKHYDEFGDEKAMRIYNHLSVYTHGLATLAARGNHTFSDEDIDKMLSEVYNSLVKGLNDESN